MLASNPYSAHALANWLKTKDPNERYDWVDCTKCLYGQYAKSIGTTYYRAMAGFWEAGHPAGVEPFDSLAISCRTFGEALGKLQAYL